MTKLKTLLLLCVAVVLSGFGCATRQVDYGEPSGRLNQATGYDFQLKSEPLEFATPPGIDFEDGLTNDEAVAVALWNNAAFQSTLTDLGFANGTVIEAGQFTNPSFSILFPWGPKQLEFAAKFPLEALWLRSKRVKLAEADYQRAAETLVQNGLNLIRDVNVAFASFQAAERNSTLARNNSEILEEMSQLADARLSGGDISELEAGNARIQSLQAREEARRLNNEIVIAEERLRTLLGLGFSSQPIEITEEAITFPEVSEIEELLEIALASRPDLRAAELAIEAAGQRAGLARSEIYQVTGVIDANGSGSDFEIGPGLDLVIPIFNQNQGRVTQESAQLEKAIWNYVVVRDQIALEVREAHMQYQQATEALIAWQDEIVPSLEEFIDRSLKAYEAGEISYLLMLEQNRQLIAAQTKATEAQVNMQIARANLERGIGQRLSLLTSIESEDEN